MIHSLYLFPEDPYRAVAPTRIISHLEKLELVGDALDTRNFLIGNSFFQLLTFAGCSPSMQLTPPADGSGLFVHIRVHGPLTRPGLIVSRQYSRPRCPNCRGRIPKQDFTAQTTIDCAQCAASHAPEMLDWRHYAATGRVMVEIFHVFPGEVVPSDILLKALRDIDHVPWEYGWAESSEEWDQDAG